MTDRKTVNQDVVEFIKLGQRVSLDWRVHIPNWITFDAAMRAAVGGNRFDPQAVANTFRELFDGAMSVEFGREASAVMYVGVPYFTGQRMDQVRMGTRIPNEERQTYTQAVIDWARSMHADEITVQQHPHTDELFVRTPGPHPYSVRIWWD